MSVNNAKKFIKRLYIDSDFRKEINKAPSVSDLYAYLKNENLSFSVEDFVEAHSNMLANAPTPDVADELRELEQWWYFISATAEN